MTTRIRNRKSRIRRTHRTHRNRKSHMRRSSRNRKTVIGAGNGNAASASAASASAASDNALNPNDRNFINRMQQTIPEQLDLQQLSTEQVYTILNRLYDTIIFVAGKIKKKHESLNRPNVNKTPILNLIIKLIPILNKAITSFKLAYGSNPEAAEKIDGNVQEDYESYGNFTGLTLIDNVLERLKNIVTVNNNGSVSLDTNSKF